MTQDEIIEMARQAGVLSGYESDLFQRFAKLVAAAERKDCAELCMDLHTLTDGAHNFYQFAANQILERGKA